MNYSGTGCRLQSANALTAAAAAKLSILFVCAGNVCRSPAGQGVMEYFVARRGLKSQVKVDSAGILDDCVGAKAAWRMRLAAFLRGYRVHGRARMINRLDLDRFDLVIAMDRQVQRELQRLHSRPSCQLSLLSEFLPDDAPPDVPDPINKPLKTFHVVLDMIEQACPAILDILQLHLQSPFLDYPYDLASSVSFDGTRAI